MSLIDNHDAPFMGGLSALASFSVSGTEEQLERDAKDQNLLLGDLFLEGEAGAIYGEPNAGKTLITAALTIQAVRDGRIQGSHVFHINMDDSIAGVSQKAALYADYGINMLVPGRQGFKAAKLVPVLESMIVDKSAKGTLIIIDTMKKLADLMSKKETSAFADVGRRFVGSGGTIVGLAHTNKHRSARGKLIYAGTSDIRDDFDCAYTLDCVGDRAGVRTVKFENIKRRGGGVSEATYSYSSMEDDDYLARVLSVKETDGSSFNKEHSPASEWSDEDIIETLELAIKHTKPPTKMALLDCASTATKLSREKVRVVLERYTGDDPTEARWQFIRGAHGKMLYSLHTSPGETGRMV